MGRASRRRRPGSVVVATMATLRRNVRGEKFFAAFDPARRDGFVRGLVEDVGAAFKDLGLANTAVSSVSEQTELLLCDGMQGAGLVPEFPLPPEERVGFVFEGDENSQPAIGFLPSGLAVTCGVEDHLQMRSFAAGLDAEAAWERLDRLDSAINAHVDYAFRRDIGYLTANPALAGNALEFSVFMMPIGLELQNAAEETMRDMRRLGCVFEQTGAVPALFSGLCKISFDCGGSRSEAQCAAAFRRAIDELAVRELDARAELAEEGEAFLLDAFSRDLSTLRNAYAISADEAIAKFWTVKYGIEMGYISCPKKVDVLATIGSLRSPGVAISTAKNPRDVWETVMQLFDQDQETRDDAEDYIDTVRADFLRWLLRDACIIE